MGLIATSLCSKAQVRVKAILIILMNVVMDLIPSSQRARSLLRTDYRRIVGLTLPSLFFMSLILP